MMKRNIFPTLAAAAFAMSAGVSVSRPAEAASVVTTGSNITGVDGVYYDGTLYDATFFNQNCDSVFDSYGGNGAPFAFTTSTAADGIANALAAAVNLAALAQGGDTVAGISPIGNSVATLSILTPYAAASAGNAASVTSAVDTLFVSNVAATFFEGESTIATYTKPSNDVFAVWTAEATPAPEPASIALLAAGVAGVAATRRQKKRK